MDFLEEINNQWQAMSDARIKIANTMVKWAEHLGIDGVGMESTEEYDDNNYYTQWRIAKLFDEDYTIERYYVDDEISVAFEAIREALPANSYKFITDGDKKITASAVEKLKEKYEEDWVDLGLKFLERGIDLNEAINFLTELCDLDENTIPDQWQIK